MKTFLFLDDWMLDAHRDIVRRFPKPRQLDVEPVTEMYNYATVIRDPQRGCYRSWYNRFVELDGKTVAGKCLAESDDGFSWTPVSLEQPVDRLGRVKPNAVFSGHCSASEGTLMYDPRDPDPGRRYKLTYSDRVDVPPEKRDAFPPESQWGYRSLGLVAYSPDGIHWRIDDEHPFYTVLGGCDTAIMPLFNPVTGRYQVVVRPSVLDRRIAIVESPDFLHWTDPLTIFTPDALDEPCMQFYGMPWFCYEDMFIGLLWDHHINQDELMGPAKWGGIVDSELAYSYNGVHWNRTNRQPFIGRSDQGKYGCGSLYSHSLLLDETDQIRIYSVGLLVDHALEAPPEGYESVGAMIVHQMRKDGFAYLEPRAGWGTITMRCMVPQSGVISLNFRAPVGKVLVQICEHAGKFGKPAEARKPYPGFSFEECIPLSGDELHAAPRWKERSDASELVGKIVQLQIKLFQAELYAVRWDVKPCYGDYPIERI